MTLSTAQKLLIERAHEVLTAGRFGNFDPGISAGLDHQVVGDPVLFDVV